MTNPIKQQKILCVIGARGGSQSVVGKNIRLLFGKPLITWAIEKALAVSEIDRVVVSTDSEEIAAVARRAGAEIPFIRPAKLASSDAGKFQVWQHALKTCEKQDNVEYDLYIDIDCTNPLIETTDIEGAIKHFRKLCEERRHPDAVFTIAEARRNPYFNMVEPNDEGVLKMSKTRGDATVVARQRAPRVFDHVAGTYVITASYLRSAVHLLDGRAFGYEIPGNKAFDIDSELDLKIIEYLLKNNRSKANEESL